MTDMQCAIEAGGQFSRRRFIEGAVGLAALATAGACAPKRATASQPPTGIQLYSVRNEMAKDAAGTLKRIAEIGYKEVEFHDYFGVSPSEIARIVADLGMTAPSAHMNARAVRDDMDREIALRKEAGHDYALIAWLHPDDRQTIDQYKEWADFFNGVGAKCRSAGIQFAYHNHDFEFMPIGGVTPFDVLMERSDRALVQFELDFYWAVKGGRKIEDILALDPDRFTLCHVKDMAPDGSIADVGAGVIDFTEILSNRAISRFKHRFVENDNAPDQLASAVQCHEGMSRIIEEIASM